MADRPCRHPLNARFATEAADHGWHIVDAHVNPFFGHAICNSPPDNWINQNLQALRTQGELDETDGLPIAVSGGIVHPNRDGYAAIGAALRDRHAPGLHGPLHARQRARHDHAGDRHRLHRQPQRQHLEPLRSGYWHRSACAGSRQRDDGRPEPTACATSRTARSSTAYRATGRYFVITRACGPLSRNALRGCGPTSSTLPVSTFVPAQAGRPARRRQAPQGVFFPTPGITVTLEARERARAHDTRRTIVRLVGGGTTIKQTVPGRSPRARVNGLQDGATYRSRCAPATTAPLLRRRSGPSARRPTRASRRWQSTCCRTSSSPSRACRARRPGAVRPALGPGTPGFEDPTPTFQPSCPATRPRPRCGCAHACAPAATVELRWRHPRRWRALHDVDVQFLGRRGVLATLRFDQDANRLTLTRRGVAAALAGRGRAGRLAVRGVTCACAPTPWRLGPGGRRRAAALRR